MPNFTIQTTTKSHCGLCHGYLDLLCEDDRKKRPLMFFICWPCRRVTVAGVGEITREGEPLQFNDHQLKWIMCVIEELVMAGGKPGDSTVALQNLRQLIKERDNLKAQLTPY